MKNYLFIVNPISGNTNKGSLMNIIAQYSLKKGVDYAVIYTSGQEDEKQIRDYIDLLNPRKIIVCGGDGTFNLVAGLLIGSKIPIGIVPAGSANGLATELRIPKDINEAVKIVFESNHEIEIDAIKLNDAYYSFHLSDLGFNARMITEFEKIGERGMIAYAKAFFYSLKERKTALYKIDANGNCITTHAEMVVIANAARYGTGAVISPSSKINDGTFEIVIFKPIPAKVLLHLTLSSFLGNLENSPYVDIIKTTEAVIKTDSPQYFQTDGQILDRTSEVSISIIKKAVTIIVP